jgi:hypothetical protein
MPDVREQILARIKVIAEGVDGIAEVVRNVIALNTLRRPGIILLDGDEDVQTSRGNPPARGGIAPAIVAMSPQLWIVMEEKRPTNVNLGPEINAFRWALLQAIAGDADLKALIGSNGDLAYSGATTDLKSGAANSGQMRLDFTINYVLKP